LHRVQTYIYNNSICCYQPSYLQTEWLTDDVSFSLDMLKSSSAAHGIVRTQQWRTKQSWDASDTG